MDLYNNVQKFDGFEQRFTRVKPLEGLSDEFLYQNYYLGFCVSPVPEMMQPHDKELFMKMKIRSIEQRVLDCEKIAK